MFSLRYSVTMMRVLLLLAVVAAAAAQDGGRRDLILPDPRACAKREHTCPPAGHTPTAHTMSAYGSGLWRLYSFVYPSYANLAFHFIFCFS